MIDYHFFGPNFQPISESVRTRHALQSVAKPTMTVAELHALTDSLCSDVEKLLMITEALWTMMKEKHDMKDEELINLIQYIDMRDGKLDGKVAKQEKPYCPHCGRKMIKNQSICMYCGKVVDRDPFER